MRIEVEFGKRFGIEGTLVLVDAIIWLVDTVAFDLKLCETLENTWTGPNVDSGIEMVPHVGHVEAKLVGSSQDTVGTVRLFGVQNVEVGTDCR